MVTADRSSAGLGSVDGLTGVADVAGVADGLARLVDLEGQHDLEHAYDN